MAGKILITPNAGSTTVDPTIAFQGAGVATDITLRVPSIGGLSFEGTTGQLFSISDSMSGTIFSVNDISGIPSIEVLDTGLVKLAQYSGNMLIGTGTDNATDKLQVNGSITSTVLKSSIATGTAPLTVTSTTRVSNLNVATAGTADTLTTARTINGTSFNGSANITVTANTTNALTIGTGLSGTSFNGSAAVTVALATGYGDTLNPYASKTANFVLAAPTGIAGVPTFRAIVAADIPNAASGAWFSGVVKVAGDGVMEVGRYIDFHSTNAGTSDYDVRIDCSGVGAIGFGSATVSATTFSGALSGNATTATSSSIAGGVVWENHRVISANYTMTADKSGISAGPITINTGITVTIPSGGRWVIL